MKINTIFFANIIIQLTITSSDIKMYKLKITGMIWILNTAKAARIPAKTYILYIVSNFLSISSWQNNWMHIFTNFCKITIAIKYPINRNRSLNVIRYNRCPSHRKNINRIFFPRSETLCKLFRKIISLALNPAYKLIYTKLLSSKKKSILRTAQIKKQKRVLDTVRKF